MLIQLIAKTKRNQQVVGITGLSDHFKKIFRNGGDHQACRALRFKKGGREGPFPVSTTEKD